ncbi:MAG: leucine-rich repeat domain-containing protein, partial [Prevotella sp.]|nr:leucine-rich repeat domain-containing protein [Prevotella sp.]
STHNGKNVVAVGRDSAFNANRQNNVKAINLPSTLIEIKDNAFEGCKGVTQIIMPNGVTSIGSYAFKDCENLAELNWRDLTNLESIGAQAFYECKSLKSLVLPSKLSTINTQAFSYCSALTSISIIENDHFKSETNCLIDKTLNIVVVGCKESVIPSNVVGIGDYAFCGRLDLDILIPITMMSISVGAFKDCSGTINCESQSKPNSWADDWTKEKTDVLKIVWGANNFISSDGQYKYIKDGEDAKITIYLGSATNLILPETIDVYNVVSIEANAFVNKTHLQSITIPSSVSKIGEGAFGGCSSLKSMTLPFIGANKGNSSASASTLFGYISGEESFDEDVAVEQRYS